MTENVGMCLRGAALWLARFSKNLAQVAVVATVADSLLKRRPDHRGSDRQYKRIERMRREGSRSQAGRTSRQVGGTRFNRRNPLTARLENQAVTLN